MSALAPPPGYSQHGYQDQPPVAYPPQQPPGYPPQQPPGYQPAAAYPPQQPNYGTYQPVGGQMQNTNTTVIVGQPQAAATVTLVQRKPNNYIGLSVFTLLCCCWLFGIIALIFALQVDSAYSSGDLAGAHSASRSARTWNIVGIIVGVITVVLVIISNVIWIPVVLIADANNDNNYY